MNHHVAVPTFPAREGGETRPASTLTLAPRAIHGGMARRRPADQAAQVLLRMSHDEREQLHAQARDAGLSTPKYLLDLAAADRRRRSEARRAAALEGSSATTVLNAENPGPHAGDRGSFAEARRTMAVVAG